MKPRIATIRLEPGHYGVCIQVPSEEFAELPNVHETIAKCPHSTNGTIPQDAQRLAACWNACHGLDIPPDIPAGAVANLIVAARAALEAYDLRGYGIGEEAQELEDALAPFTGQNLAPVSPPHWTPEHHWQQHPDHTKSDWMSEVDNGDTLLGYHEWVNHRIQYLIDNPDDDA